MKTFLFPVVILLCLACSDKTIPVYVTDEQMPSTSETTLVSSAGIVSCFSSSLGTNAPVFFYGSLSHQSCRRNPSQSWIDGYFKTQIENKQFYNSIHFTDDSVFVRLYIPADDLTLIRQAFITESEIIKLIGNDDYSAGYLYPPEEELQISWDYADSLGVAVSPGWYAFCTEFVEEDDAILLWFYLVEQP
jgi:hypothetical protein